MPIPSSSEQVHTNLVFIHCLDSHVLGTAWCWRQCGLRVSFELPSLYCFFPFPNRRYGLPEFFVTIMLFQVKQYKLSDLSRYLFVLCLSQWRKSDIWPLCKPALVFPQSRVGCGQSQKCCSSYWFWVCCWWRGFIS